MSQRDVSQKKKRDRIKEDTSRVQLVVSTAAEVQRYVACHTSIMINGQEFTFDNSGIKNSLGPQSHQTFARNPRMIDMGTTTRTGQDLVEALRPYFQVGTFDMLRKSSNSFSDCALVYLVGQRLGNEFQMLEQLGGSCLELVRAAARGGSYVPSLGAAGFDVERVVVELREAQVASEAAAAASAYPDPGEALGRAAEALQSAAGGLINMVGGYLPWAAEPAPAAPAADDPYTWIDDDIQPAITEAQLANMSEAERLMTLRYAPRGNPHEGRGATPGMIAAETTTMTYKAPQRVENEDDDEDSDYRQCMVCLEAFQTGNKLRILPCLHKFHLKCIDHWLTRHQECPVCKHKLGQCGQ
eukprot:TRINITY_DN28978_c0_g1_i1.p1 TRINITY_DN28978_c0_g1~~TRINITY_DN28978_c0_g1_i1.p1  ORF type:complete len:356 (-),score=64.37 TRINITY_DN28978_c0_g1_i1:112-1179(-)